MIYEKMCGGITLSRISEGIFVRYPTIPHIKNKKKYKKNQKLGKVYPYVSKKVGGGIFAYKEVISV